MDLKEKESDKVKRTNVRLPSSVHKALKMASVDRGITIEQLVLKAVMRELDDSDTNSAPTERLVLQRVDNDLRDLLGRVDSALKKEGKNDLFDPPRFAGRFFQYLPVPVAIKTAEDEPTYVWCNKAYGQLVGVALGDTLGKTTQQVLGLSRDHVALDHLKEIVTPRKSGGSRVVCETFTIQGKEITLSTFRFLFRCAGKKYVGDLSFLMEDLKSASSKPRVFPSGYESLDGDLMDSESDTSELLALYTDNLTTVAALKNCDGYVLWCNNLFAQLAGYDNPAQALGKTSAEIFELPETHETIRYDCQVVEDGLAVLGPEIVKGKLRTAVHFPIYGKNRKVKYIGVVSSEPDFVPRTITSRSAAQRSRAR